MAALEELIDDRAAAVHATVGYADVFDMPIDVDRLHRFLVGLSLDRSAVEATVAELVADGRLARRGDLVFLPGRADVLDIHDERTARAATMWNEAILWGRRIGRLPFVRMVAVTGGLAVDSVAEHDDIDYFIIVRPGRLWLTRLLILVLARFAARDDIELCPNFIVADERVEMDERTVYVARELAQMVVLVGRDECRDARSRNDWMFDFLPNATVEGDERQLTDVRVTGLQRFAERVMLLAPFGRLERWEMNRKIAKLQTVRSRRPEVGAPDESSFSPDICKGHMVGNAAGIDIAWRERLTVDAS
ncbi:MAG: hypothetical protein AAF567_12700 [Actinomycetota bacterium]